MGIFGPAARAASSSCIDRPAARGSRSLVRRSAILIVALSMLFGPRAGRAQSQPAAQEPTTPALRTAPAAQTHGLRVLFLYGEPRLTPAIVTVDGIIRATLESR